MKSLNSAYIKSSIFLLIVSLNLLLSCSNEKPESKVKNDLDKVGLKGKIKTLNETEYQASDKFGDIQKGNIQYKFITIYNESGNTLEWRMYDSDGNQYSKVIYEYDNNRKIIEKKQFHEENINSRTTYKYDEKGMKIESDDYKSDGSLESKYLFSYDEQGNISEMKHYDKAGNLVSNNIGKYDENGSIIETTYYKLDGSIDSKATEKYDVKGNKLESTFLDLDKPPESKNIFKYDDSGKLIEETESFGGSVSIATYRYEKFDKFGNWLIKLQEGELIRNLYKNTITEREIEYY